MKKAIVLTSVIVMILAIFIVIIAYNGITFLKKAGDELREEIWPDFNEFNATIFAPKSGQEINVDNSVRALICSINAITHLDKEMAKKVSKDEKDQDKIEKAFNEIYNNKEFWKNGCGDIKPSYYTREIKEESEENKNSGKLCEDNLGVCVYLEKKPNDKKKYYERAEYNEKDKNTCPEERPYCQMICTGGYSFGDTCTPGKKECTGISNNFASYCLASGVWCRRDCTSGALFWQTGKCVEETNVHCDDRTSDILDELKAISKQVQAMEGVDCTGGKAYGASCVKCAYDSNPPFFKCFVNNFNLPQEYNDEKGFFEKWIAGFGDPKYLVYYEVFPEGEDKFWQVDYGALGPLALYGGAISAIIMPANPNIISKAMEKATYKEIFDETVLGGTIKFFKKQLTRIKSGLFLMRFKDPAKVFKLEMMEESLTKIVKQRGFEYNLDNSRFLKIINDNIDDAGRIIDETKLTNEIYHELESQLGKKITLSNYDLQTIGFISDDFVRLGVKPSLASNIDIAAARIARNFDIPLSQFFKKGQLSEEALDAFLETGVKRGEDLDYIIKSGLLKDDFDLLDYLRKLNSAMDQNLDADRRFAEYIKPIIESLEKRSDKTGQKLIEKFGNFVFTKTPLGFLTDQVKLENRFLKLGLGSFNTKNRAFTLLLISWMGDLIESENEKFMPHGVNTIVLKTPNMFGYEYEYDMKGASPYTIIIKTKGKDSDAFKRMYFASPCKADLEVSKVEFHQILTSSSFWLPDSGSNNINNYDVYNFGSGDALVKKNTLGYKKINYNFKIEEKINDVSNYREALQKLKEIESSINENTKLSSIFGYAEKKLDDGDIEKALKVFVILAKYYPLYSMDEDVNVYEKIDEILIEPSLFLKIERDKLKEIAFEELNTIQERAEFFYKYMNDENCKSVNNYIKNNCDEELDYLEFSQNFVDSPYIKYLVSNFKSEYAVEFWNYYLDSEEKTISYITNKYKASLFYINNPYNYQNKEDEEKAVWNEYYAEYPSYTLANYGNFKSGKILIPTHIKYKIKIFDEKKVPEYPNFIAFSKYYLPTYVRYKEDIIFKDDSDIELFEKKEYFEDKAISSQKEYYFEKDDLIKWINISQEIQRRGLVDASFAVKSVDNIELKDDLTDLSLTSWGIEINAKLDKYKNEKHNYCYQSHNPLINDLENVIFVFGFVLDDVVGGGAALVCSSSLGPETATFCYKTAAAATNIGIGVLQEKIKKLTKWPKRG